MRNWKSWKKPLVSLPQLMGVTLIVLGCGACPGRETASQSPHGRISAISVMTADYALENYRDDIIDTLAHLVSFKTVAEPNTPSTQNSEFLKMTAYLKGKAEELGFDVQDHGAVVVIGLGESTDKLGLITHADVQPADPSKWAKGPFELDRESEPGRLIGRGAEDDKGPIAIALYSMKSLADKKFDLKRRVELIISYTEESDWDPMMQFLRTYAVPALNIALDSKYPVVTAEKGYCLIQLSLPSAEAATADARPVLDRFTGGSFSSQVPEDAVAVIDNAGPDLRMTLEQFAAADSQIKYRFEQDGGKLIVTALGESAHSSEPEFGINAITHLAALLDQVDFRGGTAALYVDFINEYVGTGFHGEQFGDIAYEHDFMGPLTLALTTLEEKDGRHVLTINLRSPAGKASAQIRREIGAVLEGWKKKNDLQDLGVNLYIGDPHLIEGAPHIPVLLNVFSHYAGVKEPQALSAGGGTHARLFPNGVSFGPHMPGRPYTGHTEHEYLSLEELNLDIQMYTAMLVELAAK